MDRGYLVAKRTPCAHKDPYTYIHIHLTLNCRSRLTAGFIYSMRKSQRNVKKICITFSVDRACPLFRVAFNINRCFARLSSFAPRRDAFARQIFNKSKRVAFARHEFRCIVTCNCVHFTVRNHVDANYLVRAAHGFKLP